MWTDRTRAPAILAGCLALLLLTAGCRTKSPCKDCDGDELTPPMGLAFSIPGGELTFFSLIDNDVKEIVPLTGRVVVAGTTTANGEFFAIADAATDQIAMLRLPGLGVAASHVLSGTPTDIDLDRLGVLIYATTINGNFWRYNITSGSLDTLEVDLRPRRFALRPPNRQQAWIACSSTGAIYVMDLQRFVPLDTLYGPSAATDVVFSASGERAYLAFAGAPGRLCAMDANTRTEIEARDVSGGPFDMAISADGRYVAATDSGGARLVIWDVVAGNLRELPLAGSPGRVCFRYEGSRCYVLVYGVNRVYDIEAGTSVVTVTDSVDVTASVRDLVLWEYRH